MMRPASTFTRVNGFDEYCERRSKRKLEVSRTFKPDQVSFRWTSLSLESDNCKSKVGVLEGSTETAAEAHSE